MHSQSRYCRSNTSFDSYNVRFEHIFSLIEVSILEISFRKIVFVEDVSSKFEFVCFLDRTTDVSDRSSIDNSILKINVLQVIDPLTLGFWRTENVSKATTVEG